MTQDEIRESLMYRWSGLLARQPMPSSTSTSMLSAVFESYAEPHRKFHTLQHLHETLEVFHSANIDAPLAELAVWFHDIIYVPGDMHHYNEELSCYKFLDFASVLWIPDDDAERVCNMIMATQLHNSDGGIQDLVCDADMAILGFHPDRYREYREQIRQEFSEFSDGEFRSGRKRFLEALVHRRRIYHTEFCHEKFEQAARANIASELALLG